MDPVEPDFSWMFRPDLEWLTNWTHHVWDVAFSEETLKAAKAKKLPYRVNGHYLGRNHRPVVSIDDEKVIGTLVACATGCHLQARDVAFGSGVVSIMFSRAYVENPQMYPGFLYDPAGWLALVTHEVAHHLVPPIMPPHRKPRGRPKRKTPDFHGKPFQTACKLIATRMVGLCPDDLDEYIPPNVWSKGHHSVDLRIAQFYRTLLSNLKRQHP